MTRMVFCAIQNSSALPSGICRRLPGNVADGDLTPTDPHPATCMKRFIAKTTINGEVFRCIFEVSGKKLRAISLVTMAIKTK